MLPLDQYLRPVVQTSFCLIFFQVHSCSVRNCCGNVVAVDPRNRLPRFSFDGPGDFIVPLFFFHSSSECARLDNSCGCSDKNFIKSQSHAQKNPIHSSTKHGCSHRKSAVKRRNTAVWTWTSCSKMLGLILAGVAQRLRPSCGNVLGSNAGSMQCG